MTLPENIAAKAFKATNGELAWRRQDLEEAIIAVRDSHQAILGGEVWLIADSGTWNGLIPAQSSNKTGVWQWQTNARSKVESWDAYCDRTAKESMHAARFMKAEDDMPASLRDRLRFNLTYIAEDRE